MNHKKHEARENAMDKRVERDGLAERPTGVPSNVRASQGRFPGETALTGEDRPSDAAGDKQEGFDQDAADARAAAGHPAGRRPGIPTTPQRGSAADDRGQMPQ